MKREPAPKVTIASINFIRDRGGAFWTFPKVNVWVAEHALIFRVGWRWTSYGLAFSRNLASINPDHPVANVARNPQRLYQFARRRTAK